MYCECGCGKKTTISKQNHRKHGWVKGKPLRFLRGHYGRAFVKKSTLADDRFSFVGTPLDNVRDMIAKGWL